MQQLQNDIEKMLSRELELGGRASLNYKALPGVRKKDMTWNGFPARLFFNPARVASVMAKVDKQTLLHRQCFLCPEGLEAMQQSYLWKCSGDTAYFLRVNPFPIFERHFTISTAVHTRQEIAGHYAHMLEFSSLLHDYDIFYNGPMCGASAPDHMHFQACPKGSLPMQVEVDATLEKECGPESSDFLRLVTEGIWRVCRYAGSAYLLCGSSIERMQTLFDALMEARRSADALCHTNGDSNLSLISRREAWEGKRDLDDEWEPRMNILSWSENGEYRTVVFFRSESRPACFFEEDPVKRILISPASVEMSGIAVVSSEESFERLSARKLNDVISEVSLSQAQCRTIEAKLRGDIPRNE